MNDKRSDRQRPRRYVWMVLASLALAGALVCASLGLFDREARLRRLDVATLQRAAAAHPSDARLHLMLGRRLRQAGDLRGAFQATNRAYDLSQGGPEYTAAMAGALIDARDFGSASRLLQDGTSRWPRSGEIRAVMSRLHAGRGHFTDALADAETAVRLAPRSAESWQALGVARSLNKRPDDAFAAFERAREFEPRDAELLADSGEALVKYGRVAQAEAVLEQAVALAPRGARQLGLLGQLRASRARTAPERAAARGLLERALALAPKSPEFEYDLALLELRDGREVAAIRLLQSCLAEDPRYGEAHLALGQAYQRTGQTARARQAFARWQRFSDFRREAAHLEMRLRRSPDDVDLLRRLARLHTDFGDPRTAAVYRQRAQALESRGKSAPVSRK